MRFRNASLVGTNETFLLVILGALTLYRAIALAVADLPLYLDEAYYFDWSRTLEFGYYSKPPLIAWVIATTTHLCGESELCLRAPALLIHPFTAFALFLVGRRLYGTDVGRLAAVLYATLPMVFASSWIISTDVLLLFFWAYGLWFLVRALENDLWGDWLGLGICCGMGLLSKYTMVAFPLSLVLYLGLFTIHRHYLRHAKFYVALMVAVIIFSPNIFWNISHDLVSLRHTAHNAALDHALFNPSKLLEFLGSQVMVFGPILSVVLLMAILRQGGSISREREWGWTLLFTLSLPLFVVISGEAFAARAYANWAAPSYLGFSLIVAAWLADPRTKMGTDGRETNARLRLLILALVINIFIGGIGYHYDMLYRVVTGAKPPRHLDPYARLRGWRELAERVQALRVQYPMAGLLGDDRSVLAELGYYLHPRPSLIVVWNPTGTVTDHYKLNADLRHYPVGEYLFVARSTDFESVSAVFSSTQDLGKIRISTHRDSAIECRVYWARNFRGYTSKLL